jgi:CBS domain-containing protein
MHANCRLTRKLGIPFLCSVDYRCDAALLTSGASLSLSSSSSLQLASASGAVVRDVMSTMPAIICASDPIKRAAQLMAENDAGVLPVSDDQGSKLVGMLTDRDLVVRVLAEGRDIEGTPVSAAMSKDVKYCFEDESVEHVVENMAQQQVRLPTKGEERRR